MRTFNVCLLLIFCFSLPSFGQKFQSLFHGEENFKNIRQIPKKVLNDLKSDEWVQRCFKPKSKEDFSSEWFEATEINLNSDNLPDLLIKGKDSNSCINGNAISFWVFVNKRNGYDLVLNAYTISLRIMKQKSKGYYKIRTYRSTANTHFTTFYAYNGKKYLEKGKKEIPVK